MLENLIEPGEILVGRSRMIYYLHFVLHCILIIIFYIVTIVPVILFYIIRSVMADMSEIRHQLQQIQNYC